jgi:hypothetical protein
MEITREVIELELKELEWVTRRDKVALEALEKSALFQTHQRLCEKQIKIAKEIEEHLRELAPDAEGKREVMANGYRAYMQKRDKKNRIWDIAQLEGMNWAKDLILKTVDEKKIEKVAKIMGISLEMYCTTTIVDQSYPVIKKIDEKGDEN